MPVGELKEFRCKFCHRLLFSYNFNTQEFEDNPDSIEGEGLYKKGVIELKCSKCKRVNKIPARMDLKDWQFVAGSCK